MKQLERIINDLVPFHPTIVLTGGEPLLHKDFIPLIKIIKKNGLSCNIFTNGTLLSKYANEIINAEIDRVMISVDGLGATHDKIRGVKGSFSKVVEGINKLNSLKEQSGKSKPIITINCTISEGNYSHLIDMLEICNYFKFDILHFNHLWFLSKEQVDEHNQVFQNLFGFPSKSLEGLIVPDLNIDVDILWEQIIKIKKIMPSVVFFPDLNSKEELLDYYKSPPCPFKQIQEMLRSLYECEDLTQWRCNTLS